MNKVVVRQYMDLLEEVMEKCNIRRAPERIYNADETGIQLTMGAAPKVFAGTGAKRVYRQVPSEKAETVSVMAAASATGSFIPPFVVYKGKRHRPHFGAELPAGGVHTMNETGYFNKHVFLDWLEHFNRHRPQGECLLVVDGHRSHVNLEVAERAEQLGINLMCLPANTTHELQPLDKAFFDPLKREIDDEYGGWLRNNPGKSISKGPVFEKIFTAAYGRAATSATVINGFRGAGNSTCL